MEVVATAKWVRTTARKARLVAATVQGLPVDEALTVLSFTPRVAAVEVAKVIRSAAANAEHNYNLDTNDLRVARVEIEGASIIKRFRPRAQGRAYSVFKRTTHLRAYVTDEGAPIVERRPRRRTEAVAAAPPPAALAPRRRRAQPAQPAETAEPAAPEATAVAEAPSRRTRTRRAAPAAAEPAPADMEGSGTSPTAEVNETASEDEPDTEE